MIERRRGYLRIRRDDAPEASAALEREGFTVHRGALAPDEVKALREDVLAVFARLPGDERQPGRGPEQEDFRYEMLNRSASCQKMVGDRRILDVIEPLLGEDCHVIANTAWRNPPRADPEHGGGRWHIDAGPHVPRPAGVPWDDRIPYPVFAVATHVMLEDCPLDSGPTAAIPRSHRSGRVPPWDGPTDLTCEGQAPVPLVAEAGDLLFFASDVWHRRLPTGPGDTGRLFLQIHYGRRDIAQRLRRTDDANQLSNEARERATNPRDRTVIGLHPPFFYDG